MKLPITGTISIEEAELYKLQQNFFSRLHEKTLTSGISHLLRSEDELTLYSTLNSLNPGHSIMKFSAPQSTSNWAVEPLEFKLLGARVIRDFNEDLEYIQKDVEAVDIKGTFDVQNRFFRDFTLVYKSAMKKTPDTYLNYSMFEGNLNPQNGNRPFEINYKVRSTPQEVRNYMPLFENYFTSCIDYFLPKSPSSTFKRDQFSQFEHQLLQDFNSQIMSKNKSMDRVKFDIPEKDDIVVVNDVLVRNYLNFLQQRSK